MHTKHWNMKSSRVDEVNADARTEYTKKKAKKKNKKTT